MFKFSNIHAYSQHIRRKFRQLIRRELAHKVIVWPAFEGPRVVIGGEW